MDYSQIYDQLIINRQQNCHSESVRTERHHILPKAVGGTDEKNNLVDLSCREHFIAHRLLAKIYGGAMWSAVVLMSGLSRYGEMCNSKTYELAKKKHADMVSVMSKARWADPEERAVLCEKLSEGVKLAYKNNPDYRDKASRAAIKRWKSDEYREKFSASNKGVPATDEAKKSLSDGQKRRYENPEEVEANKARVKEYFKNNTDAGKRLSDQAAEKWQDEDSRRQMTEERRQRWEDPAYREKMTKIAREKAKDPEYRRKQSESHKGKPVSEETREKLRKANTGKKRSPEAIQRMRDAQQASRAKKRGANA